MLKALTFAVSTLLGLLGSVLILVVSNAAEYAGGLVAIGGAIAGVFGLLRKLAEDRHVSESYGGLIDQLQEEVVRLQDELRRCREGLR